ncbi:zinc fingers and homeoboxes protein 3 [Gastrophryne carolinensis]
MASKRKSTTPCMIPLKTLALDGGTDMAEEYKGKASTEEEQDIPASTDLLHDPAEILSNGHENVEGLRFFCKYCNFGSQETSPFVEHMNKNHPDFRDDSSYVCIACSFLVKDPKELEVHNSESHTGDPELSWTVAKHENYTVVEQSVSSHLIVHDDPTEDCEEDYSERPVAKTPIMRHLKNRSDTKKIVTLKDNSNSIPEEPERKSRPATRNGPASASKVTNHVMNSPPIVNGSIIGPVLQTGLTQLVSLSPSQPLIQPKIPTSIAPALPKQSAQKSQSLPTAKSLPKVMIPLSSIPTYNASMDANCFLKNSFNKFPYPTKAELCYLTVVTKYPEEQIKIWFTAQRLKQGISWSPEEIEDSRKKMFNTIIQSIPQPMPQPTITVLNAPLVTSANGVQHLIQATLPGQIVSQPQGTSGVLVTQPIIANGYQGAASSVSLAVAPISSSQTAEAESYLTADSSPPNMPSSHFYDGSLARIKKSRYQLNSLKNSFCKSQFPTHSEIARLTKITGLSTREVRKWFSDKRYHFRNKPQSYLLDTANYDVDVIDSDVKEPDADFALHTSSDMSHTPSHAAPHTPRRHSWHQTPDFAITKYKERAPEQLRALESSFSKNNFPADEEVTRLRSETKMTRREIDGWFSEKRKRLSEELKREKARYEEADNSADDTESSELKASNEAESRPVENSSPVEERKVNPIKINLKALRVTDAGDNADFLRDDGSIHSDGSSRPSTPQRFRTVKKTAQQRDHLKQMFVKTQWPSSEQYDHLVEQTGLPRPEIVRWFGDNRYCFKIGNLKWYEGYRKNYADVKPATLQPLLDYYGKHQALNESDIHDLCGKSGFSQEEIRNWFADRLEEDNPGTGNDSNNDKPLECADEFESTHCERSSEVSENDPMGHESSTTLTIQQQSSVIQLEKGKVTEESSSTVWLLLGSRSSFNTINRSQVGNSLKVAVLLRIIALKNDLLVDPVSTGSLRRLK